MIRSVVLGHVAWNKCFRRKLVLEARGLGFCGRSGATHCCSRCSLVFSCPSSAASPQCRRRASSLALQGLLAYCLWQLLWAIRKKGPGIALCGFLCREAFHRSATCLRITQLYAPACTRALGGGVLDTDHVGTELRASWPGQRAAMNLRHFLQAFDCHLPSGKSPEVPSPSLTPRDSPVPFAALLQP